MRKWLKLVKVIEWYEKRDDGVYLVWEFEDGKRMERKAPFKDIPHAYINHIDL